MADTPAIAPDVTEAASHPARRGVRSWVWFLATPRVYYLVAALGLYLALVTVLLVSSDFLPYVTDNNESFSMWVHARNMLHFGFWHAAGLSDEAYSLNPAAHPYVYTHEGNFPRFFIYLLMRLGVMKIEWQIVISALVIGGATIYLCFKFFSGLGSDLFAFLVCAVFTTDYLLFMQWEVNTFRVWHGFLFFLSLVCVQALGGQRGRRAGVLLLLTFIALFYFEIVFALFTAVVCVCYALLTYWRRRPLVVTVAAFVAAGAVVAVGGLFMQSTAYLGWTAALRDIELTFLNRNFHGQLAHDAAATPLRFYLMHHIVYWEDQPDTRGYLSIGSFLRMSGATLRIDTPYLLLLVWTLVAAWVCRLGIRVRFSPGSRRTLNRSEAEAPTDEANGTSYLWAAQRTVGIVALVVAALYVIVNLAARGNSRMADHSDVTQYAHLPGFPTHLLEHPTLFSIGLTILLFVLVVLGALTRGFPRVPVRWRRGVALVEARGLGRWSVANAARIPGQTLALAMLFLLAAAVYELEHWRLYGTAQAVLWLGAIEGYFRDRLLQAGLLGALLIGLLIVLDGGRRYLPLRADRFFGGVVSYLTAGGAAYVFLYVIFPGYLSAGYLGRYAPLPVFLVDVWIALFFYMLVLVARAGGREIMRETRGVSCAGPGGRTYPAFIGRPHLVLGISMFLLIFGAAYWARVQAVYIDAFPPTGFLFVRQLARAPYEGATFVSNNYSAPITYFTGTWAYADPLVQESVYATTGGRTLQIAAGDYLWEADRASNPDYLRPRYYICIGNPDLNMAAALLALHSGQRLMGCSNQRLIHDALRGTGRFHNVVVASDPSPRDMWTIVRLDPSIRFSSSDW